MSQGPKPAQQGHLDVLCGVYSIINCARITAGTHRISFSDAGSLYGFLLAEAVRRGWTRNLISTGISIPQIGTLLQCAQNWLRSRGALALTYRKPFHRNHKAGAVEIFESIGEHLSHAGTAAILGMDGMYDWHWTVAYATTRQCIQLADSTGRKRLLKHLAAPCGYEVNSSRPFFIPPSSVFLVQSRADSA